MCFHHSISLRKYVLRTQNCWSVIRWKRRLEFSHILFISVTDWVLQTHHAETRKPAFRWLGLNGKRSEVTVEQSNKRAFGMDVTNADLTKRSRLISLADKTSGKLRKSDDLKDCNLTAQKQLQTSKGYVFGPFTPVGLPKRDEISEEKGGKKFQSWEAFASSFHPEYHNQGLLSASTRPNFYTSVLALKLSFTKILWNTYQCWQNCPMQALFFTSFLFN